MIKLAGSDDESGDRAMKMFEDQVVDWQASVRDALAKAGVNQGAVDTSYRAQQS